MIIDQRERTLGSTFDQQYYIIDLHSCHLEYEQTLRRIRILHLSTQYTQYLKLFSNHTSGYMNLIEMAAYDLEPFLACGCGFGGVASV